jgi:hypothetical protein
VKAAVIYENGGPEVLGYEDVRDPECRGGDARRTPDRLAFFGHTAVSGGYGAAMSVESRVLLGGGERGAS